MIPFATASGKQRQMFWIMQPLAQISKPGVLVSLFRYSFTRDNFRQIYVFDALFRLLLHFFPPFFGMLSVHKNRAGSTPYFLPDVSYSEVGQEASNIGAIYRFLSQQLKLPLLREG